MIDIYDLKDVINSINYYLKNGCDNGVEIQKSLLLRELKHIHDLLLDNIKKINKSGLNEKLKNSNQYILLAYKIKLLEKNLIEDNNKIKISQHIFYYLQNA